MVIMSSKHLNAQYNLRWPDELKEKIAQSAKEHNRSMNADIVARLEESFNEVEHSFKIISKETTLKVSQDVIDEVLKVMKTKNAVSVSLNELHEKNK